jgi:hypothetical protein
MGQKLTLSTKYYLLASDLFFAISEDMLNKNKTSYQLLSVYDRASYWGKHLTYMHLPLRGGN